MLDYTAAFIGKNNSIYLPARDGGPISEIYKENLIDQMSNVVKAPLLDEIISHFSKNDIIVTEIIVVSILKDGLVVAEDKISRSGISRSDIKHFDWSDIAYVKISRGITVQTKKNDTYSYIFYSFDDDQIRKFKESWDTYQKTGDIPNNVPLVLNQDSGIQPEKKSKFGISRIVAYVFTAIVLLFVYGYLLNGANSFCEGRNSLVAEQVPYALGVLSERHPLSVGLIRNYFNQSGNLDSAIADFAKYITGGAAQDAPISCAISSISIRFDKDSVRAQIADQMEEGLGIKNAP